MQKKVFCANPVMSFFYSFVAWFSKVLRGPLHENLDILCQTGTATAKLS